MQNSFFLRIILTFLVFGKNPCFDFKIECFEAEPKTTQKNALFSNILTHPKFLIQKTNTGRVSVTDLKGSLFAIKKIKYRSEKDQIAINKQISNLLKVKGNDCFVDYYECYHSENKRAVYLVTEYLKSDFSPSSLAYENFFELKKNFVKKLKIYERLAFCVSEMHRLKLVHNDLKLGNIMTNIDDMQKLKLIDLEFATEENEESFGGTHGYFPPEFTTIAVSQKGKETCSINPLTYFTRDLYALGVILAVLEFGYENIFDREYMVRVLLGTTKCYGFFKVQGLIKINAVKRIERRLAKTNPNETILMGIISRLLHSSPEFRGTALELLADLRKLIESEKKENQKKKIL